MHYIENEAQVATLTVRYSTGKRGVSRTKVFTDLKVFRGWEKSVLGKLYLIWEMTPTYKKATKMVRNLMTGKLIEIDVDTPWCCNPASETYWSM